MTERVKQMLSLLRSRTYKQLREAGEIDLGLPPVGADALDIDTIRFEVMLQRERVNIFEGDLFGFNRTLTDRPFFVSADGVKSWPNGANNVTPGYSLAIDRGFDDMLREIRDRSPAASEHSKRLYAAYERYIRAICDLCERYRKTAEERGDRQLSDALSHIPNHAPRSLYEACLFQKILIFAIRCAGNQHVTLGRFDQYMYPYYQMDIARGVSREELLETLELYFISLNFDIDLYMGIQEGDNGQSMVLGGYDKDGHDQFNELSSLCMDASLALHLIDPKINLRVSKKTPMERFEYGTRMTKQGLGFPQYCNDDVVVPGLTALGYDLEDALDYTVAACWEFIIPGKAYDIPNMETFNFPLVVGQVIREMLPLCGTFEELMDRVTAAVYAESERLIRRHLGFGGIPCPMLSILTEGCIEKGSDIADNAAKYNCMGCHGAGIAVAADSLAAVQKLVYDQKAVSPETLLRALDADFVGYSELRNQLRACPKMGNNDDYVDRIAALLMDAFSKSMNGKRSNRGGFWRAGTGSAQEYIHSAAVCPATPDGRAGGEPYGSSFSPAVTTRPNGPLSVIQSFTKFDLKKIINGGPLTMEFHDTVFRNAEGERKVAALVKLFIDRGGHQLQLNAINRERLLDAQAHPEDHQNLIVRVWGWSGYFCELDKVYQDHIIRRAEFTV